MRSKNSCFPRALLSEGMRNLKGVMSRIPHALCAWLGDRCPLSAFVPDDELDYERSATRFEPGAGLLMDEAYRRAHLPLVAPHHPRVIPEDAGRGYRMGRHETIWSLVIPVDWEALEGSPGFRTIDQTMRAGPLASKLGWQVMDQRRHKLHATIAGNLARGEIPPDPADWRAALSEMAPFRAELRGLFSGNINLGRLYFKLYPEWRAGTNAISALQRAMKCAETRLYLVGHYLLIDQLDAEETRWLAARLEEWQNLQLIEFTIDHLALLGACDDLALDSTLTTRLLLDRQDKERRSAMGGTS